MLIQKDIYYSDLSENAQGDLNRRIGDKMLDNRIQLIVNSIVPIGSIEIPEDFDEYAY